MFFYLMTILIILAAAHWIQNLKIFHVSNLLQATGINSGAEISVLSFLLE
jgi:hypothetical protein